MVMILLLSVFLDHNFTGNLAGFLAIRMTPPQPGGPGENRPDKAMDTKRDTDESQSAPVAAWQKGAIFAILFFISISIYVLIKQGTSSWYHEIGSCILISILAGVGEYLYILYRNWTKNRDKA